MKDSSEKFMSFILNFGLLTARITLFFIFAWRLHPKSREGKDAGNKVKVLIAVRHLMS